MQTAWFFPLPFRFFVSLYLFPFLSFLFIFHVREGEGVREGWKESPSTSLCSPPSAGDYVGVLSSALSFLSFLCLFVRSCVCSSVHSIYTFVSLYSIREWTFVRCFRSTDTKQ